MRSDEFAIGNCAHFLREKIAELGFRKLWVKKCALLVSANLLSLLSEGEREGGREEGRRAKEEGGEQEGPRRKGEERAGRERGERGRVRGERGIERKGVAWRERKRLWGYVRVVEGRELALHASIVLV